MSSPPFFPFKRIERASSSSVIYVATLTSSSNVFREVKPVSSVISSFFLSPLSPPVERFPRVGISEIVSEAYVFFFSPSCPKEAIILGEEYTSSSFCVGFHDKRNLPFAFFLLPDRRSALFCRTSQVSPCSGMSTLRASPTFFPSFSLTVD